MNTIIIRMCYTCRSQHKKSLQIKKQNTHKTEKKGRRKKRRNAVKRTNVQKTAKENIYALGTDKQTTAGQLHTNAFRQIAVRWETNDKNSELSAKGKRKRKRKRKKRGGIVVSRNNRKIAEMFYI